MNTVRVKTLVFTVTSGVAGLAGAFYGHYVVVLSPQIADFSEMAKIIVMTVVGGFGSFAGPLVGAPRCRSSTAIFRNMASGTWWCLPWW